MTCARQARAWQRRMWQQAARQAMGQAGQNAFASGQPATFTRCRVRAKQRQAPVLKMLVRQPYGWRVSAVVLCSSVLGSALAA
ncbi:hypothetical protein NPIL_685111 [Nephila pilipes]|uniref:Uncharacterized protein n=1 Tax=Nephila pilipes TaxID=299642 RepID=A0A8X6TW48_NEPPI|nr:hypothetical protein NPIL_685111 [Nephila pilipes]